ncbi:hypothetical protein ATE84_5206 [Aquimarina sp. MAR_2010_214]|uniref:hypothetical protein n=1 Tax=Aquimarina sp. MAR_2010_214 TaxID=1250026 RepID=UPI000C7068A7|nr:hypothetical protein [Aquimarina sp. MAR_2010_214]PKV53072.1 hypothetical protein ATE84_5206 [Aquimarina sp. MAR_2010_214]
MEKSILFLIIILFGCSCKKPKNEIGNNIIVEKAIQDTTILNKQKNIIKNSLVSKVDLKEVLNTIGHIKHTKEKHKDWMSNKARTLDSLFQLNNRKFSVKTTSYEYKDNLKFYVHVLRHTIDTISIKPFLENAQGKTSRGYTQNRVLIFAMKNDKEANFIDIPEKLNPLVLREELLDILYKNINSDVIECYRTKECMYKDLRKNKQ